VDEHHFLYFISFDLICDTNFRLVILFSMFDKVYDLLGLEIMGKKAVVLAIVMVKE
jgi:hypothetical protein